MESDGKESKESVRAAPKPPSVLVGIILRQEEKDLINQVAKFEEKDHSSKKRRQSAHTLGKSGEKIALRYLEGQKYRVVARNFRLFRGEIDIIAYDRKTLVFIEVKTRKSTDFGLPEESVTPSKQKQIKKIAQWFLTKNDLDEVECRFDIISLIFNEDAGYSIRHIKDAF